MNLKRLQLILLVCSVFIAGTTFGQTSSDVNAGLQFNFSNPGARSLGMGGAFLGLADDATAAYTNPAGLLNLSVPEVSFEWRNWDFANEFTDRGHLFGPPTMEGADTIAGRVDGSLSDSTSGLSFVSYVYPRERWSFAVYRHELANFKSSIRSEGAFLGGADDPNDISRLYGVGGDLDLDIVNYGGSFAFRLGKTFSLGLGLSYYDFSLDSTANRYDTDGFYGPTVFDDDHLVNFQTQQGDDSDTAVNVGILWAPNRKVHFGAVYRQGPSFDLDATAQWSESFADAFGIVDTVLFDTTQPGFSDARFNVPDTYGAGVAFWPTDSLVLSIDVNRVEYSSLTDGFIDVFNADAVFADPNDPNSAIVDWIEGDPRFHQQYRADNGTELRVGLEYTMIRPDNSFVFRAGGWNDPDHRLHYVTAENDAIFNRASAALFPNRDDDDTHYSVGFGWIRGERFQMDFAGDFSDRSDTFSISAVSRF